MKYITLAAAVLISTASAACPDHVTVEAFDDKECTNTNTSTAQLQEDWDFLARVFNQGCYQVGDKYMQWECDSASIKASIYSDDTCKTQNYVAKGHPLEKEFKWGQCTQYGNLWIKINQQ